MVGQVEGSIERVGRGVAELAPAFDVDGHDFLVGDEALECFLDAVGGLESKVIGHFERRADAQALQAAFQEVTGGLELARVARVETHGQHSLGDVVQAGKAGRAGRAHEQPLVEQVLEHELRWLPVPPRARLAARIVERGRADRPFGAHTLEHRRIERLVFRPRGGPPAARHFTHALHARQKVAVVADRQPRGHVAPVFEAAFLRIDVRVEPVD